MAKKGIKTISKLPPALTPEARENQMIAYSMNLAEQKLIDGTASPSIVLHFLKLGSMKTQLELEKIKNENLLLAAKTKQVEGQEQLEKLYSDALKAMSSYSGDYDDDEDIF